MVRMTFVSLYSTATFVKDFHPVHREVHIKTVLHTLTIFSPFASVTAYTKYIGLSQSVLGAGIPLEG